MPAEIEVYLLRAAAGLLVAFLAWFLRDSWRRLRDAETAIEAHGLRLQRAEMRLDYLEEG